MRLYQIDYDVWTRIRMTRICSMFKLWVYRRSHLESSVGVTPKYKLVFIIYHHRCDQTAFIRKYYHFHASELTCQEIPSSWSPSEIPPCDESLRCTLAASRNKGILLYSVQDVTQGLSPRQLGNLAILQPMFIHFHMDVIDMLLPLSLLTITSYSLGLWLIYLHNTRYVFHLDTKSILLQRVFFF